MRIPRLYLPVPLAVGARVLLSPGAFNHAVRVLRLKAGAPVALFNGLGGEFQGVLESVSRREAAVRVEALLPREAESPLQVLLAQCISRGERMDYTLQKAVELGVAGIMPLLSEHAAVSPGDGERLARRLDHWRGVVIAACQQCGRNRLPPVQEPRALSAWLADEVPAGLKVMLEPLAACRLTELAPAPAITLLIGPEGGFSPAEITRAQGAGFIGVRLGPRIMRTETAGLAALAALQTLWGDLS